jgi:acyl-CoA synthetase (AMP-forming)/AMP-acid ligase II
VLKSGGFKISALDIEREILEHPKVAEAIVVGVDDLEYGQRIAAAVVLKPVRRHLFRCNISPFANGSVPPGIHFSLVEGIERRSEVETFDLQAPHHSPRGA